MPVLPSMLQVSTHHPIVWMVSLILSMSAALENYYRYIDLLDLWLAMAWTTWFTLLITYHPRIPAVVHPVMLYATIRVAWIIVLLIAVGYSVS